MNAKQFAWVYLVMNGMAGCKPSFYGGYDLVDERLKKIANPHCWDYTIYEKYKNSFLGEISLYGVDWNMTMEPHSEFVSKFNSTFSEPDTSEDVRGNLILRNGLTQFWSADELKISNVFEALANVDEYKRQFIDIFDSRGV